ncbi:MAG TPA: hypothetical protein VFG83_10600 [Kofleriaceae bacterium]|nr:hypothetical protein [Kofleriaceae bacterium]
MRSVFRLALLGLLATAGCSKSVRRPRAPVANRALGTCAESTLHGVVSADPDIDRADRDLDGDGEPEVVARDRNLCSSEGNCHWNVFVRDAASHCTRYVGTISGAAIERLDSRGQQGFYDLRTWWRLATGNRVLMQEYHFRLGGYRMVGALLCNTAPASDGELLCAPTSHYQAATN